MIVLTCMLAFPALGEEKTLTLPESLASIEEEAFSGTGFEFVQFPEGIRSIADNAFGDLVLNAFVKVGTYAYDWCVGHGFPIEKDLVTRAQEEGELVVYGSCSEDYLRAVCEKFEETYGIRTVYQRLSVGEISAKVTAEGDNPSGDVLFSMSINSCESLAADGLLLPYEAVNADHLLKSFYRDTNGYWYGVYQNMLVIMVNKDELTRLNLSTPQSWSQLLNSAYKGHIWLANYNTAGTAKLLVNTIIQMKGHDAGVAYLVDLDKNVAAYTRSGSGPIKKLATGECAICVGLLSDGIHQINDVGYENIQPVVPAEGTSYDLSVTCIVNGASHPNAAKLWTEFCLSPACADLLESSGVYFTPLIDNAKKPAFVSKFSLNTENVINYDFEDALQNTFSYVEDVMNALGGEDERFLTN